MTATLAFGSKQTEHIFSSLEEEEEEEEKEEVEVKEERGDAMAKPLKTVEGGISAAAAAAAP